MEIVLTIGDRSNNDGMLLCVWAIFPGELKLPEMLRHFEDYESDEAIAWKADIVRLQARYPKMDAFHLMSKMYGY